MSWATQKSWSVALVKGYILNGKVRADHCKGCECTPQLILGNNGNCNLFLYGCNGHKCKQVMIRLKFYEIDQSVMAHLPSAVAPASF